MATTQKQVKTRIQQKHDTSENWGKATSFVPLKGEIIVYDDLGRIKVGDGTKTVSNLKFVDEHSHLYLPLTGGTLTGDLTVSDGNSSDVTISSDQIDVYNNGNRISIVPNGISFLDPEGASIDLSTLGISFSGTGGTLKGISDSKGAESDIAVSQKCLNDNYLSLSGGTLTGALTATKFTGNGSGLTNIPAGNLTGTISSDRLPDLSNKYLPLTGGEVSGSLGVRGEDGVSADRFMGGAFIGSTCGLHPATSTATAIDIEPYGEGENTYLAISTNSFTHYSDMENSVVDWTFTGISDAKGTSSTLAMSQKGVADNYLPLSGGTVSGNLIIGTSTAKRDTTINGNLFVNGCKITGTSSGVGTSTTEMPTLKCLHDNYLALSGGTLTGQLTLSSNGIKFNTNAIKDITYSTTDLTAGTSTLATNSIYIVYE